MKLYHYKTKMGGGFIWLLIYLFKYIEGRSKYQSHNAYVHWI
jgi:hypothetical protein